MKMWRKLFTVLCMALVVGLCLQVAIPDCIHSTTTAQAATKVKLNKQKATLTVGDTLQLKISGTKSKVTWSSSNKKIAKVSKKGKVTAIKAGTATITAKVKGKKYKCKITVKKAKPAPTPTPTPTPHGTYTGELSRFIGKDIDYFNSTVADPIPEGRTGNQYFCVWTNSKGIIYGMRLESGYDTYKLVGVYPGMTYGDAHQALIGYGFLNRGNGIYDGSRSFPNKTVILGGTCYYKTDIVKYIQLSD